MTYEYNIDVYVKGREEFDFLWSELKKIKPMAGAAERWRVQFSLKITEEEGEK